MNAGHRLHLPGPTMTLRMCLFSHRAHEGQRSKLHVWSQLAYPERAKTPLVQLSHLIFMLILLPSPKMFKPVVSRLLSVYLICIKWFYGQVIDREWLCCELVWIYFLLLCSAVTPHILQTASESHEACPQLK